MALPSDMRGGRAVPTPPPMTPRRTTTSKTGGTTTASTPASTPSLTDIENYIRQNYGYMAWALDDPELGPILRQTDTPGSPLYGADKTKLQGAIEATNWWKTHSQAQRNWLDLQANDPGQANSLIGQSMADIRAYADQMGVPMDDATLRQLATDANSMGMTQTQIHAAVASHFYYNPDAGQGAGANVIVDQLKNTAAQFLQPLSNSTIQQWGRDLIAGNMTKDDFISYMKQQAESTFNDPNLIAALDRGQTVRGYLDPYVQDTARELEINPDSIDLTSGPYKKLLQQKDPTTGLLSVPTRSDWISQVRNDSVLGKQYDRTQGARSQAAQLISSLGNEMGIQ